MCSSDLARPHETIDAVLVAAHIVVALQSVVARSLDPDSTGVVTVGSIQAGNAGNVIAETALLRGTVRAFEEDVRQHIHQRITEIAHGVATTFGASVEVTQPFGTDVTICAPPQPRLCIKQLVQYWVKRRLTLPSARLVARILVRCCRVCLATSSLLVDVMMSAA